MTFPSSKSHTLEREEKREKGKRTPCSLNSLPWAQEQLLLAPLRLPLGNKLMASANKKGTGQAYG